MIFEQLDIERFRPKFIRLEYVNLTEDEKQSVRKKLIQNDYYFEEGFDILAVDNSIYRKFIKTIE